MYEYILVFRLDHVVPLGPQASHMTVHVQRLLLEQGALLVTVFIINILFLVIELTALLLPVSFFPALSL